MFRNSCQKPKNYGSYEYNIQFRFLSKKTCFSMKNTKKLLFHSNQGNFQYLS